MGSNQLLGNRVAFITEGASGIGWGIARHYATHGARVVLASRDQRQLDQAVKQLRQTGAEALAVAVDVRDYSAVEQSIATTLESYGSVDVLVNTAADQATCPSTDLSPDTWKTVIDVDLNGTFHCCKAAYAPLCRSRFGGRIINITMTRTIHGWPGYAHAAAAKAGVLSLTRSLAVEWGGKGIRVNAIAPGLIADTEASRRLAEERGLLLDRGRQHSPLGQLATIQDIADMALLLISPAANHINGIELTVDGGAQWLDSVILCGD